MLKQLFFRDNPHLLRIKLRRLTRMYVLWLYSNS
jgi:hypothetical protein